MNLEKLSGLKDLYPGYFSLSMATGILSIGLDMWNVPALANFFFAMAGLTWLILFFLYTWRLLVFPQQVLENLLNTKTTFVFFTFVAATAILGLLAFQHALIILAVICWILAFLVWSLLLYCSFTALSFAHPNRNVNVVHGGWLILIVGTQSLVILGAALVFEFEEFAGFMMIEILMLWSLGLIFYAIFVTLFCYRIFFKAMQLKHYSPLMWVIMGAAAISANAGISILQIKPMFPALVSLLPMIKLISIMLWTWATWWIPLLLIFGIWKHIHMKVKLTYDPMQWSIVFPLGMYAVITQNLATSIEFSPLSYVSHGMLWLAFVAWIVVASAMIKFLLSHKTA